MNITVNREWIIDNQYQDLLTECVLFVFALYILSRTRSERESY